MLNNLNLLCWREALAHGAAVRLHDVRGERKALMAARPFVPEAEEKE